MEFPASMLDELPKDLLNDMEDLDQSSYSTGTSSESEDEDYQSGGITEKFDTAAMVRFCPLIGKRKSGQVLSSLQESHIVCRKSTTIICSDGKKVTKASTAIIPSAIYSTAMHDHSVQYFFHVHVSSLL